MDNLNQILNGGNKGKNFDVEKFLKSIATLETGGVRGDPYKFKRFSGDTNLGNAIGKYQVTEAEFNKNLGKYLPSNTTVNQFQNTPSLQDQYMRNQANYRLSQGFTPQQIADFHRKGAGVLEGSLKQYYQPGSAFFQAPDYVVNFTKLYDKK